MATYYDFTLGADPEFYAKNCFGELVRAKYFFRYDESMCFNKRLGRDGGEMLFEIRPTPAQDPFAVVKEIKEILTKMRNSKKFMNISTIHANTVTDTYDNYTVGGHIHFGYQEYLRDYSFPINLGENGICNKLANYLGILLYSIESKKDKYERRRNEYGGMFDFRNQPYGIEYRAPSSWLISPLITTVSLCLAKTVFFQILNPGKFEFISGCPSGDVWRSSRRPLDYDQYLSQSFDDIFKSLSKMTLYPMYKDYLDLIPNLYKNKLSWYSDKEVNLFESWSIK